MQIETAVLFEQTEERLKVTLPLRRNWFLIGLFSILLLAWIIMFVGGIVFTLRDVAFSGERFAFAFTVMLLILLLILYYLGRFVWRQWQYYFANRELLFINKEVLIVRRPVSLLGLTDAYDMAHVQPFYVSEKNGMPAFDYGYQHIYFGFSLDESDKSDLVNKLNDRFFPYFEDDD